MGSDKRAKSLVLLLVADGSDCRVLTRQGQLDLCAGNIRNVGYIPQSKFDSALAGAEYVHPYFLVTFSAILWRHRRGRVTRCRRTRQHINDDVHRCGQGALTCLGRRMNWNDLLTVPLRGSESYSRCPETSNDLLESRLDPTTICMGAGMMQNSITAVVDEAEARRKSRQGSETREMKAFLRVRYHENQLEILNARAGKRLPSLIRQYADLLIELLPLADAKGVDPADLIRQAAELLLHADEPQSKAS